MKNIVQNYGTEGVLEIWYKLIRPVPDRVLEIVLQVFLVNFKGEVDY